MHAFFETQMPILLCDKTKMFGKNSENVFVYCFMWNKIETEKLNTKAINTYTNLNTRKKTKTKTQKENAQHKSGQKEKSKAQRYSKWKRNIKRSFFLHTIVWSFQTHWFKNFSDSPKIKITDDKIVAFDFVRLVNNLSQLHKGMKWKAMASKHLLV